MEHGAHKKGKMPMPGMPPPGMMGTTKPRKPKLAPTARKSKRPRKLGGGMAGMGM